MGVELINIPFGHPMSFRPFGQPPHVEMGTVLHGLAVSDSIGSADLQGHEGATSAALSVANGIGTPPKDLAEKKRPAIKPHENSQELEQNPGSGS